MNKAERIKTIGKASAIALHKQLNDGFLPKFIEAKFSEIGLGSIEIQLDNAKMLLDGRIDRVDILEKDGKVFVKIIDYKSGSKVFDFELAKQGIDLQLLLYLDAFIKKMQDLGGSAENYLPAAIMIFNLKEHMLQYDGKIDDINFINNEYFEKFKGTGLVLADDSLQGLKNNIKISRSGKEKLPKEDFLELIKSTQQSIKKAGEGILEGIISPAPYKHKNKSPCEYCKYGGVCKHAEG